MWGLELQLTRPVDFGATRISVRPSASGHYTLKQRRRHTVSWICWPVLRRKHMTMVAAPSLHGEGVLALQQKFSKPSSSCWVEEAGTEKHDFSSKQPVWFFFGEGSTFQTSPFRKGIFQCFYSQTNVMGSQVSQQKLGYCVPPKD